MNRTSIFILLACLLAASAGAQTTLRMNSNQRLDKGQKIEVAGKGKLTLQTDGNLVVYDAANAAKWATGTNGKTVTHVIMQTDGNLVIYNNSTPVWASDTWNVGANGGYFEVDPTTWTVRIYKSNNTVAKELNNAAIIQGGVTVNNVNIGELTLNTGGQPLKFPRQQSWESQVCTSLGMTGVPSGYASMTPFQQAVGSLALDAAEAYFTAAGFPNYTPQQATDQLKISASSANQRVTGVLGALIIDKLKKNGTDAHTTALRTWGEKVFRDVKVQAAIGTLKEYNKWSLNPCTYSGEGYEKPQACNEVINSNPIYSMWTINKPPADLLGKAGMAYAAGNNDVIATGVSYGLSGVTMVVGYAALVSSIGATTWGLAASQALIPLTTSLYSAFSVPTTLNGVATGMIGATGWAGAAAGPASAIVAGVVIGVTQGLALLESAQVGPRLTQAINTAMTENYNMVNVMSDENTASLFLIGLIKSKQNGWKTPDLKIDGEVTFFCEAGYLSQFQLTYTLNGQSKGFSTPIMSAGQTQRFVLPADATNIVAKGYMLSAGSKEIFNKPIAKPNYICFKVYGTILYQQWNNDWPLGISGTTSTTPGEVKCLHSAGFIAKWNLSYDVPGQARQTWDSSQTAGGYTVTWNIPANASNIRILVQGDTGLAWEPWRTTYDKTFPAPPNFCLKIYGTTLDQKWNNDCN